MTDHDYGEDRDPLLVRPFVLGDSTSSPADEPSGQTWPSATTREVRSHRALEGADAPTAIFRVVTPRRRLRPLSRNRVLIVAAAGLALLVGGAAVGMATLRPDDTTPPSAVALDDPPPLATGGPLAGTPSPVASPSASSRNGAPPADPPRAGGPATSGGAGPAVPGTAGVPTSAVGATTVSPSATDGDRAAPSPPNALVPDQPTGTIRGQNALCLDLNGGVAVEGNFIQVATCNDTPAQSWTLATDGTLRVAGMCAFITGANTVAITKCDGRTTAQWKISGQLLISAATARCLTDPSGGTRSGTPVRVNPCDGTATQRWSLP
ncbi:ricin-type beta-trefoil lectin domain protein [Paractinoplanes rishiriensis]|uniref:Ricin B lectin domain-containing protein n=1 Tax=Paractinoplanes rishiriensis TaxID=1050105 RepID=A0A919MTQ6_9ACTN|nr:ricin-type beta-trefoil lectin domain protein [Actinoplanes rishiriensis]GIE95003.1 hypothetical protein Ari01nite_24680 [Actinoplanes rishiriensis]